jgi:hypothetical protein
VLQQATCMSRVWKRQISEPPERKREKMEADAGQHWHPALARRRQATRDHNFFVRHARIRYVIRRTTYRIHVSVFESISKPGLLPDSNPAEIRFQ